MDFGKIETYGATLVQSTNSGPNGLMKAMARARKANPGMVRSPEGYDNVEAFLPEVKEKPRKSYSAKTVDTQKVVFRSVRER